MEIAWPVNVGLYIRAGYTFFLPLDRTPAAQLLHAEHLYDWLLSRYSQHVSFCKKKNTELAVSPFPTKMLNQACVCATPQCFCDRQR